MWPYAQNNTGYADKILRIFLIAFICREKQTDEVSLSLLLLIEDAGKTYIAKTGKSKEVKNRADFPG